MYLKQIWLSSLLLLAGSGSALCQNPLASGPAAEPPSVTAPPSSAPTATPHKKDPATNPADASAHRQSGLSSTDARSLLEQNGYTSINGLHASSTWVWQADGVKNGRRVRLGIDYRGHLLELSTAPAQPCTPSSPGFGAGPLGTGARLSEATRCLGR